MSVNALGHQAAQLLRECLDEFSDVPVSAAQLANCAQAKMTPIDDPLSDYLRNYALRAIARPILARQYDPRHADFDERQHDAFESHLQSKYPCVRNGANVYVPRDQTTTAEIDEFLATFKASIESRQRHYRLLADWNEARKAMNAAQIAHE